MLFTDQVIQITKVHNFQKWLGKELMTSRINLHYIYGKKKVFLPKEAVNVPRKVEDVTKCCYAGMHSNAVTHLV